MIFSFLLQINVLYIRERKITGEENQRTWTRNCVCRASCAWTIYMNTIDADGRANRCPEAICITPELTWRETTLSSAAVTYYSTHCWAYRYDTTHPVPACISSSPLCRGGRIKKRKKFVGWDIQTPNYGGFVSSTSSLLRSLTSAGEGTIWGHGRFVSSWGRYN